MKKSILFLALSMLMLVGCGKPVHEIDQNYIGVWEGVDGDEAWQISIGSNSSVTAYKWKGATTTTYTGTAKLNDSKTKLSLGFKKFTVDSQQTFDSNWGDFVMVLDGITFYRY